VIYLIIRTILFDGFVGQTDTSGETLILVTRVVDQTTRFVIRQPSGGTANRFRRADLVTRIPPRGDLR